MKKGIFLLYSLFISKVKDRLPFVDIDIPPPSFKLKALTFFYLLANILTTSFSLPGIKVFDLYHVNQKLFSLHKYPFIECQNNVWYLCKTNLS